MRFLLKVFLILLLFPNLLSAKEEANPTKSSSIKAKDLQVKTLYTYIDRSHSLKEDLAHLSAIYVLGWGLYYLSQRSTFEEEGSLKKFRKNFGKVVFDKDEPIWNWVGHPYTGSQMYLFYRARGYTQMKSLKMTFFQSALFEFTTEIYTEPASIQDLYQTPILGSALGFVLEKTTLALLNSDFLLGRIIAHILNPSTLFWFYEGKVQITPRVYKDGASVSFYGEF